MSVFGWKRPLELSGHKVSDDFSILHVAYERISLGIKV